MNIFVPIRKHALAVVAVTALSVGLFAYRHDSSHASTQQAQAAAQPTAAPQAAAQGPLPSFTDLVARNGPAVVNITVEQPTRNVALSEENNPFAGTPFEEFFRFMPQPDERPRVGLGSGFLVSEDGYLLTNAHVVGDATTVKVKLTDKREFKGKVIGRDRATDIALVKINASDLPHVTLGDAKDLRVGEWVVAIGSPYGFDNSVTAGIVSAKRRSLPGDAYVPFIQTDVAVNPGNSGGPLFNLKGEVVGINSQIYSLSGGYQGLSFAIPADIAQNISDQLRSHGKVTRGWMGVTIQEVDQDLASSFKLDKPRGALVAAVVHGSPAESAGVRSGDVIVAFSGQPIESSDDLPRLVASAAPGEKAKLDVVREGKPLALMLEVAALPERHDDARTDASESNAGKLGVVVADLSAQDKKALNIDHGVQVRPVVPGAAARAGVEAGDVILQMNGKRIDSVAMLETEVARLPENQSAALLVKRGDATVFVPVTPAKAPAS